MTNNILRLRVGAAFVLLFVAVSAHATPSTSYYIYDEAGHVIGEYDANGNPIQEHIYLGDRPVAVVQNGSSSGGTVDYVTTDQLNTPRVVTDSSQAVIWQWNSDPYGNGQPTGSLTYNLRFPGQYYDSETGNIQNGFRNYDSSTGRYLQSDLIGLNGGMNTYVYADGNTISNYDPSGLDCIQIGSLMKCAFPGGGPNLEVPMPSGTPSYIGPDGLGNWLLYHNYDVSVPLNGADAKCVMQQLINNPTPGNPSPATPDGTRNNASVFGMENSVTSYLTSDLANGNPIVTNVADANSLFPPGYVARTVSNGMVHTYGEGLSALQAIPGPQALGNWYYWKRQMEEIVKKCTCAH